VRVYGCLRFECGRMKRKEEQVAKERNASGWLVQGSALSQRTSARVCACDCRRKVATRQDEMGFEDLGVPQRQLQDVTL